MIDEGQFVYKPLAGDGEIVARAVSIGTTDFWAKGGVMIRETLDSNSRNAFMLETPNLDGFCHNEPVFQWRSDPANFTSDSGNHNCNVQAAPVWLRLVRSSNNFSGFWAQDLGGGTHGPWNQLGPTVFLNMATTVYVGLMLTAHNNNGALNTSTFDNLSIAGTTAALPPGVLRLTDGDFGEAGDVFTTSRVGVTNFTTTFTFRMHDGIQFSADGMAFVLQSVSPTAVGGAGGGLGYAGIANSVAVKFDLWNNQGEGFNSTGLFFNGDFPGLPSVPGEASISLDGTGIDLHSQDLFRVTLSYSGTTLTETITDTQTGARFSTSYTGVNIEALLGSDVGYVGFGGGTGGLTTVADVPTWTYQFASPVGPTGPKSGVSLGYVPLGPNIPDGSAPWIAASALAALDALPAYGVGSSASIANPGASGLNPEARMSPDDQRTTNVLAIDTLFSSPAADVGFRPKETASVSSVIDAEPTLGYSDGFQSAI